jgi:hypothetical protein
MLKEEVIILYGNEKAYRANKVKRRCNKNGRKIKIT